MKNQVEIENEGLRINGKFFSMFKEIVDYRGKDCRPVSRRFIECAYNWNQSNPIRIYGRSLKSIAKKVINSEYKIVKRA